eukprot:g26025.t1
MQPPRARSQEQSHAVAVDCARRLIFNPCFERLSTLDAKNLAAQGIPDTKEAIDVANLVSTALSRLQTKIIKVFLDPVRLPIINTKSCSIGKRKASARTPIRHRTLQSGHLNVANSKLLQLVQHYHSSSIDQEK